MTDRQLLLQHLANLSDEDVHALLPIVERLRAHRIVPANAHGAKPQAPSTSARRHPERFGPLAGSVRFMGDIESPVEAVNAWTGDAEHLKP